jgi:ABC-type Fe3+ transport system substrate-binding protein
MALFLQRLVVRLCRLIKTAGDFDKVASKKTNRKAMNFFSRKIAALLFGLGAFSSAAVFSGCNNSGTSSNGGSPSADSGGSGTAKQLAIVSPHGREIQAEFERLFKARHPDVKFKWYDPGGTSDLLKLVMGQSGQGGLKADLFFGGGGEAFAVLDAKGLLQSLPETYGVPDKLNGVPLRGKDEKWVAAALSGFGILVNQTYAKRDNLPIPSTWADLGNPKLENRIELADPRESGSAHTAYEVILQTNGWDKGWQVLQSMAANSRRFVKSSSGLLADVSSGEAVMAPAIDFYGRKTVAKAGNDDKGAPKLLYVEPKGQSVVTPDPIGLMKDAPHAELAKEFVKLVLSPEAQKMWMLEKGADGGPQLKEFSDEKGLFRMAALPAAYKPIPKGSLIQTNPYTIVNQSPYDAEKAARRRQALDALLGAVLIDNHMQLKAAWKKNPKMNYVPITEAELNKVAGQWDKASFINETTDRWLKAARQKFSA